jgi:hypothetical protein
MEKAEKVHTGLELVNSSLTCNLSDNRAVTFLMMETDLSSPWWGFCEPSVLNDFGTNCAPYDVVCLGSEYGNSMHTSTCVS